MEIENITANKIIESLCDRSGFDDWWANIDEECKEEIYTEIAAFVKARTEKLVSEIQSLSARISELEDFIGEIYNNPEYDAALLIKCRNLLTSPQGETNK